ncbi:MAG: hypothetical protein KY440_03475 [Actinobacteria bacterium]|nr:hypothetical protein [Actinomycetota bacterium]
MTVEQETQPAQPRARAGRLLRTLIVALVALLLLLAAASWLNSRAFDQLLTAVEAGESVLGDFNTQAEALVRAQPDEDAAHAYRQSAFWDSASNLADEARTGLLVEQQHVRDVRIWPWDADAQRARDRYLDHLAAWERQLKGYADREQANEGAAIEATFTLLNDALADAVPLLGAEHEGRVKAIAAG